MGRAAAVRLPQNLSLVEAAPPTLLSTLQGHKSVLPTGCHA